MKGKLRYLVFGLVGAGLLVLYYYMQQGGAATQPQTGQPSSGALPVKGYIVQQSVLDDKVFTSGSILANEEVNLTSEASGKVIGIFFTEGTRVQRGQLLVQLNDLELKAQLQKAEYRKQLVEANEYRQRVLLQKEAISKQEYDVIVSELNTAKAELELIAAQLAKTRITAPFDGTIGLRRVSEGSYVSPGMVIASLQNLDKMKLEFSIPEKYSARVHAGALVDFKVRSSDQTYQATVFAIEPKIDATTRNLQLRAIAPNPGGRLLPGAFADIELVLQRIPKALMVPTEAIIPEQKGQSVFMLSGGKAKLVPVELGIRNKDKVQVVSGIQQGDTILTTGLLQLRNGQAVKLTDVEGKNGSNK